ncbi:MAG: PKD domain-containing protein, partial [Chloroflexaceae bacterium]|nr:PKD domain-containing protein [Chloroflexaceae bacterium]
GRDRRRYTFTAEVLPSDATQPITYTWEADDQPMMQHSSGLTDTATFMWDTSGLKTIQVMAMNGAGTVSATHEITIELVVSGVQEVSIGGLSEGVTGEEYTFTAAVMPPYAATPVTYTWEADDQTMMQHSSGLTDTVTFMWDTSGLKTIQVTAMNHLSGTATATHEIMIASLPIAVEGVSISGPSEGQPGQDYTFTAEVSPTNATQPITYTWEADGLEPVTHSGGGASDTVTFSWDTEGPVTVRVTAMNVEGSALAMHDITIEAGPPVVAVTGVSISGPTEGQTGETYTFTAEVSPSDASEPVTYVWGAIGQDPVTHEDGGLTDTVTFSWDTEGDKDITVQATNAGGSADASYLITISSGPSTEAGKVYLPLIVRQ